jgi:hypothetical protein
MFQEPGVIPIQDAHAHYTTRSRYLAGESRPAAPRSNHNIFRSLAEWVAERRMGLRVPRLAREVSCALVPAAC